jgi:hypothetical protein
MSVRKLKVDALSMFFNHQEDINRKQRFRRSMFVSSLYFSVDSPSVGLAVHFSTLYTLNQELPNSGVHNFAEPHVILNVNLIP